MFHQEKYSKEAFENEKTRDENAASISEEEKKRLNESAWKIMESGGGLEAMEDASHAFDKAKKTTEESVRNEARKRLDALMKAGHAEAIELNQQYDKLHDIAQKLSGEAAQAKKDLEEFEKEKLGMTQV